MSAGQHDGMSFAIGFAVNAAATWLSGVLLIGLGESFAQSRLNFELADLLDVFSTIVAVAGALTVPAVTLAWCLIVKARWQVSAAATFVSVASYAVGLIVTYRIWESLDARIVG